MFTMDCDKFKNKYRIDSARAKWHDYDDGFYFVTICTKNRECFFGSITNSEMILSEIGKYTEERLQMIHDHYSYAEMPLWVIMPNHIHLILSIDSSKISHKKRNIPASTVIGNCGDERFQETSLRTEHATATQSWVSVVIGQFKQSVTRFAKQNNIEFLWQSRFHDHIIRNQKEMDLISEYIENNVRKWEEDCFFINP